MNSPSLPPALRVALVEDDAHVRAGLRELIAASPGCSCVADFGTAEEALARLPALEVEVLLMDIQLPGMSGIECIRRIKADRPALQVMMLTVFEDHDRIFQSLAAGASGYLLKQTPADQLLEALRELQRGGSPMSTQIARRVVETFREPASTRDPGAGLSPRERDIVARLARGFLYKEIAAQLGISVETVRTHLHSIYEKLHVRSRTEAVMKLYGTRLPE